MDHLSFEFFYFCPEEYYRESDNVYLNTVAYNTLSNSFGSGGLSRICKIHRCSHVMVKFAVSVDLVTGRKKYWRSASDPPLKIHSQFSLGPRKLQDELINLVLHLYFIVHSLSPTLLFSLPKLDFLLAPDQLPTSHSTFLHIIKFLSSWLAVQNSFSERSRRQFPNLWPGKCTPRLHVLIWGQKASHFSRPRI